MCVLGVCDSAEDKVHVFSSVSGLFLGGVISGWLFDGCTNTKLNIVFSIIHVSYLG